MALIRVPSRHSGAEPTGPRKARPDDRLREEPGIHNRKECRRMTAGTVLRGWWLWIPGSRFARPGMTRTCLGFRKVPAVTPAIVGADELISCDDLALAAVHDGSCRQLAGLATQQTRRTAAGDGAPPAAAPGRRFDAQGAEPRERLAQRAVT